MATGDKTYIAKTERLDKLKSDVTALTTNIGTVSSLTSKSATIVAAINSLYKSL